MSLGFAGCPFSFESWKKYDLDNKTICAWTTNDNNNKNVGNENNIVASRHPLQVVLPETNTCHKTQDLYNG